MTFWQRLVDIFYNTPKLFMSKEWIDDQVRKG